MRFAQVVVNVPIRRSFVRQNAPPAQESTFGHDTFDPAEPVSSVRFQIFHYSIPPDLVAVLQPGHLIWVPFGARQVQGIVVSFDDSAPVLTKSIVRLARPDPVISAEQLALASWIANYYVASLSETLKLFLPPGILTRADGTTAARVRRELQIALLVDRKSALTQIDSLARDTPQIRLLELYLRYPQASFTKSALIDECGLKSDSAIKTLLRKNVLAHDQKHAKALALAIDDATLAAQLEDLRGLTKYREVIEVLASLDSPLWKSDLYRLVNTDLDTLRQLQRAGVVRLDERIRFRDPLAGQIYAPSFAPVLTSEQQTVWKHILAAFDFPADSIASPKFLLHGATGSGKTEIYLHAMNEALNRGKQAVLLVPEIALTPQTVARIAARFPDRVTVIHSGLSTGERYDVWRHIREGQFDIVIGPRSALFAPFPNLGLIVIDEEHEASYKQSAEEWGSFTVFYDARRVAQRFADQLKIPLIMGSATPSLEAFFSAETGEIKLLKMPKRVLGHGQVSASSAEESRSGFADAVDYAELPPVEIVDMRQELRAGNRSIFSRSLQAELHATIDAGEQAILFLNRRGSSTFVMCRDCGHVEECARCETPLTYHERVDTLICHRCNRRYPIPVACPECGSKRIKYFGSGTQRVEEAVRQIEPRARLLRWDADTAARKGQHAKILETFTQQRANVLIGTQMIAKGLDLPSVTLVGVIAADVGLFLPDFRSGERTFQLLTQVAGRAGRSKRGGRVVVQTYSPDHYAIQAAAQHDYYAFYARELDFRRKQGYPPVCRLARLIYWDRKLEKVQSETARMAQKLTVEIDRMGIDRESVGILGPVPAFFARYRGNYRWQILLRAPNPSRLLQQIEFPFGWRIDVDPVSVL